jgi:hypothetical protein
MNEFFKHSIIINRIYHKNLILHSHSMNLRAGLPDKNESRSWGDVSNSLGICFFDSFLPHLFSLSIPSCMMRALPVFRNHPHPTTASLGPAYAVWYLVVFYCAQKSKQPKNSRPLGLGWCDKDLGWCDKDITGSFLVHPSHHRPSQYIL